MYTLHRFQVYGGVSHPDSSCVINAVHLLHNQNTNLPKPQSSPIAPTIFDNKAVSAMNSTMSSVLRFSGRRLVHTSNSLPAVGVDQALRSSQAAQEQQSIDGHLTKGKDSDNGLKSAALKNVREIKGVQEEDPLVVQKSLGARADQITAALM